jgi:hypothetical protein
MKLLSGMLSFIAAFLYLAGCTKTTGSSDKYKPTSITGKWNLVNDSTFEGAGFSNHLVGYTGKAGDYTSFGTNGNVYNKEGTKLDTFTYRMVSDTSIIISDFGLLLNGVPDTCTIKGLTANNGLGLSGQIIVIGSPLFITPGGEFWRKLTLSR